MAGVPERVKGGGLKIRWRRPAWVQIPPPALELRSLIAILVSMRSSQLFYNWKPRLFTLISFLAMLFLDGGGSGHPDCPPDDRCKPE